MKRSFAGIGLGALLLLATAGSAMAQDVRISLSWGAIGGRVHVADGFRVFGGVRPASRAPYRVERRRFDECVADGSYLYCWDAPRRPRVRPLVYVYATDRAELGRQHARGRDWERNLERRQRRTAERVWRRWADDHRYRYDRDRLIVDVAFAW
jgi:hypothetical protein